MSTSKVALDKESNSYSCESILDVEISLAISLDSLLSLVTLIAFYIFEKRQNKPFIDFSLFSNNIYIGTTLANLMVNMDIGSLALFNIYVQDDKHLTGAQAGLITIPYTLCSLLMIRVGERFMQNRGPQ